MVATPLALEICSGFVLGIGITFVVTPHPPESVTFLKETRLWTFKKWSEAIAFFYMLFIIAAVVLHKVVDGMDDDPDRLCVWSATLAVEVTVIFSILICIFKQALTLLWALVIGTFFTVLGTLSANALMPGKITLTFCALVVFLSILGLFVNYVLVDLVGVIQFAIAVGVTVVGSFVVLVYGFDAWFHASDGFYGGCCGVIIGIACFKTLLDYCYKMIHCCTVSKEEGYAPANQPAPPLPAMRVQVVDGSDE